ncbi:MAG: hypothetical protein DLM52_12755 [Chthoniobacterales bacterium]|nr:MAG: hypothetical protein DLM52_12755 [Chthoniobacterales bacterium]
MLLKTAIPPALQSRVLVLNSDPVFEDRLLAVFDALPGFDTLVVRSVSEAVALLMAEHFDAFIVEGEPAAAMEIATVARQHFPSLKILCAPWRAAPAELAQQATQQQIALASGAAHARRFRAAVKDFLSTLQCHSSTAAEGIDPCHSLIGNLNQFSAAEILQMACLGQRTGRFTFKSGRGNSEIYLHHGAIRHAAYSTVEGEPAMAEIFRWRQGRFYFEEGIISHAQTVDRPWAHLLIDNLQKLDETLDIATIAPVR